jgi:adenine-specific DNA-methyltransferase
VGGAPLRRERWSPLFTRGDYALHLTDIAFVKVGAVSGADDLYASEEYGNRSFVYSGTVASGKTRRMLWCEPGEAPPAVLLPHKTRLIARRIRPFDESNWWHWGRGYHQSTQPRVYVNNKTRRSRPFFVHRCNHYDGSVLAIFPRDPAVDVRALAEALNVSTGRISVSSATAVFSSPSAVSSRRRCPSRSVPSCRTAV